HYKTETLQLGGRRCQARGRLAVEFDHFGDQQHLSGDAAIGERALQPLIDEALMRRVLIDNDERILGLGDDERFGKLRPRGAEWISRSRPVVSALGSARVAARLGKRYEWRLPRFGEAQWAPRRAAMALALRGGFRRRGALGRRHALERGLRERRGGAMARGAERVPQRADQERAHGVGVAKPELGLGRMDVNVDLLGRNP